ncbi:MAG: Type 1 glutamine amidotransferase-like domain-containing protein [Oscillospiraceae bacterium]|jgi:peptidase E|nr:Type 1 glutamine amidotransferase-like domain-containing protein [Oscillospiraceae bacterium]
MMQKILLTSAGFETKTIRDAFLALVGKPPEAIRALFIPTAANDPGAIAVLPKCMNDLLNAGIPAQNIWVFDLHRALTAEELSRADAIYFTGGSPDYLLERINDTGFRAPLQAFVEGGGVYVGVSAGAVIGAGNLPHQLGYLRATLHVHMQDGGTDGIFDNATVAHLDLKNDKAVLIHNGTYQII